MRYLILFFITTVGFANTNINDCINDGKTHGSHTKPMSPMPDCEETLKAHPEKIEVSTSDKSISANGLLNLIYIKTPEATSLLAGDQTLLNDVRSISINQGKKRLLVLQQDSLATYNVDFIGNVSPLSYIKSKSLRSVKNIKLLDNEDMIALFSASQVRIVNSDADTRHNNEKLKTKLLYEINGDATSLISPSDLIFDKKLGKIFVLDSDRVLIFSISDKKNQSPEKVINSSNLSEVHSGFISPN